MEKVKNTSKEILGSWPNIPSNGILKQEKEGQKSFINSTTLPTQLGGFSQDQFSVKKQLETFGVIFKGPVPDDELFQYVILPAGWKKVETDHSMWSKLLNEKGKEIASIFYKAAFYDRDAFLSLIFEKKVETT